jgi:threonyl-tRNA synthetase
MNGLFANSASLIDDRNEKIGKKIRDAELAKRPFMLIVGEKEFNSEQVAVRQRGEGDKGAMGIKDFADFINELVEKELVIND